MTMIAMTEVNWSGRRQASLVKSGDVSMTQRQAHMAVIVMMNIVFNVDDISWYVYGFMAKKCIKQSEW